MAISYNHLDDLPHSVRVNSHQSPVLLNTQSHYSIVTATPSPSNPHKLQEDGALRANEADVGVLQELSRLSQALLHPEVVRGLARMAVTGSPHCTDRPTIDARCGRFS